MAKAGERRREGRSEEAESGAQRVLWARKEVWSLFLLQSEAIGEVLQNSGPSI